MFVAELGHRRLVLRKDAADRRVANGASGGARGEVSMEELLGHPALGVSDVDTRERQSIEAAIRAPVNHVTVGIDGGVEDAEALDDFGVVVGEKVKGDVVPVGELLEMLLSVVADAVDLDVLGGENVEGLLQLN